MLNNFCGFLKWKAASKKHRPTKKWREKPSPPYSLLLYRFDTTRLRFWCTTSSPSWTVFVRSTDRSTGHDKRSQETRRMSWFRATLRWCNLIWRSFRNSGRSTILWLLHSEKGFYSRSLFWTYVHYHVKVLHGSMKRLPFMDPWRTLTLYRLWVFTFIFVCVEYTRFSPKGG